MRYTDPIAKSKTDTEYAGGIIFKQLVEEDTNSFDDPPNYVIMVLDFTHDMVNSNDMTELEFIKTHLEYLVRANKLEFPLPTEVKDQDTLNAYYRSLIEIGKRKKLIYEALKLA